MFAAFLIGYMRKHIKTRALRINLLKHSFPQHRTLTYSVEPNTMPQYAVSHLCLHFFSLKKRHSTVKIIWKCIRDPYARQILYDSKYKNGRVYSADMDLLTHQQAPMIINHGALRSTTESRGVQIFNSHKRIEPERAHSLNPSVNRHFGKQL